MNNEMMIAGFGEEWNETEAYTGESQKPEEIKAGGYILKILGCKFTETSNGAVKMVFAFDVAEGEYSGYFKKLLDYERQFNQNAKTKGTYDFFFPVKGDADYPDAEEKRKKNMKMLKGVVTAINESNPYAPPIDLSKPISLDAFKGKLVGGIFGDVEWAWKGKTGMKARCRWFTNAAKIRSGDFKIPEPKFQNEQPTVTVQAFPKGEIISDGDVPF